MKSKCTQKKHKFNKSRSRIRRGSGLNNLKNNTKRSITKRLRRIHTKRSSQRSSAIMEESPLVTSVVKFETLVYFYPTDDDGNGVFRFEMIPRFTESAVSSHGGGKGKKTPKPNAAASATSASATSASATSATSASATSATSASATSATSGASGASADSLVTVFGGESTIGFRVFGKVAGPVESFDAITRWIAADPASIYRSLLQSKCQMAFDASSSVAGKHGPEKSTGVINVNASGIYVNYKDETHASIHFLTPENPRLDGLQGSDAGSTHFKFNLKTDNTAVVCCSIQWELSMTFDSKSSPYKLKPSDFKVGLSHKAVKIKDRGNSAQHTFAANMATAIAEVIVSVGESEHVFDDPRFDRALKSTLMRKAAVDCILQGYWKSNALSDPFSVLGLEQLMIDNAFKNKVTIAMVLEEDGSTVNYNPVACVEVSPGILRSGSSVPFIKGVRIIEGKCEGMAETFYCAFDMRTTVDAQLKDEVYPVRRLLPQEDKEFEQLASSPPNWYLSGVLKFIRETELAARTATITEVLTKVITDVETQAAEEKAAEAAEAKAAVAATPEAQEAERIRKATQEAQEAKRRQESNIFHEIFYFLNIHNRLPCVDDKLERLEHIDHQTIKTMIQRVQRMVGLNDGRKTNANKLSAHYSDPDNKPIYDRVYDEGVDGLE
jgi:hypothetical protein